MVSDMMTAEQLKGSILQLAMQGKLVEQRSEEGTGEELYAKITLEKKQLIKKGTVKKEKQIDPPLDDDLPYDIPGSWVWARFGDITYNKDSERIPLSVGQRAALKKTYDYYGASGVIDKVDQYLFDKPLLLIGEDGANLLNRSTPIAFIAKGRYWVNNHAHVLDMSKNLDMVFVSYYINSISLAKYVTGTAQPKMNQARMNSIWVPIPPLAEQKRIVAKIEELMPFVEQYAVANTKLNTLNAAFPEMMKKSILQEAVQGKLVPQDPNDEPASLLLKKIAEEKKRLIKEGKIKKQKPLPEITEDEIPFEIPESWEWVRLAKVGMLQTGTTPSKAHPEYYGEFIPFVSPGDISMENVLTCRKDGLSKEGLDYARLIPAKSVLQVCIGGSIGKAAINDVDVTCNQQINTITPYLINEQYLFYCMTSDLVVSQIKANAGGTATPIINKSIWGNIIIPIAPLNEQRRVVAKLEEILSEIRALCM